MLATIGMFPKAVFGQADEPRKFFLPESALVGAPAGKPLCFRVQFAPGAADGATGSAAVTLAIQALD